MRAAGRVASVARWVGIETARIVGTGEIVDTLAGGDSSRVVDGRSNARGPG